MNRALPWIMTVFLLGAVVLYVFQSADRYQRRLDDFSTAINRYGFYSRAYQDMATDNKRVVLFETCYGGHWDRYSGEISKDVETHADDSDYLKNRSEHFARLKDKYTAAVKEPAKEIPLDPPLGP